MIFIQRSRSQSIFWAATLVLGVGLPSSCALAPGVDLPFGTGGWSDAGTGGAYGAGGGAYGSGGSAEGGTTGNQDDASVGGEGGDSASYDDGQGGELLGNRKTTGKETPSAPLNLRRTDEEAL